MPSVPVSKTIARITEQLSSGQVVLLEQLPEVIPLLLGLGWRLVLPSLKQRAQRKRLMASLRLEVLRHPHSRFRSNAEIENFRKSGVETDLAYGDPFRNRRA